MRYRKLRIAWSVGCGILCLLLIVLWVRSYSRYGIVSLGLSSGPGYMFGSSNGELSAAGFPSRQGAFSLGWSAWSLPADGRLAWKTSGLSESFGVRYKVVSGRTFRIAVPHLFVVVFVGAIAALPWISWRFSLRTLLIATTLVAVVLGLIAYSVKK